MVNRPVKQRFLIREKRQKYVALVLIIMVIMLVITDHAVLSLLVMLSGMVFSLFNWRCPACNKYLGQEGDSENVCRYCGVVLRD